ncbi:FlxA-like family protein [Clostridioides sp. ES-W-0016-02]|uniref:FlxA-like family protein n=2 Tax=unclassified Clostridioides TaxID=2635829 RepID=UPI001D0F9B29|nr:FlxA-like family protein [Clostridioides sp. ES-W-0016-02]
MKIESISGQTPRMSNIDSSGNNQSEIQSLEQQKKVLQEELEKVKNDKSIDNEMAKSKIENFKKEIKEIESKIQELKEEKAQESEGGQNTVSEVKNSTLDRKEENSNNKNAKTPYDIFEKSNEEEQWDNTYSLVQDDKNLKVKFNRPI